VPASRILGAKFAPSVQAAGTIPILAETVTMRSTARTGQLTSRGSGFPIENPYYLTPDEFLAERSHRPE
jgi:hypothetical protein